MNANEIGRGLVFWKLAIFKVFGKACMALLLSMVASLNGTSWSSFTPTEKFIAVVVAIGAMWTTIDAFLSETMSDLKKKKELETQFVSKPQ